MQLCTVGVRTYSTVGKTEEVCGWMMDVMFVVPVLHSMRRICESMYTPPRRARCQLTHRDSSHTLFVTVRMFARTHILYRRLSPACPDYAETMEQRGSVVRVTLGIDYVIM